MQLTNVTLLGTKTSKQNFPTTQTNTETIDSKKNLVRPSQFSKVDPEISKGIKYKRTETLEVGEQSDVKSKKIQKIELNVIDKDSLPAESQSQNQQDIEGSARTQGVDEHLEMPAKCRIYEVRL